MKTRFKDPDSQKDYGFDWDEWLAEVDDTIQSSVWIVAPGITKLSESNTTTGTTIWLGGGTVGTAYIVTNRIVTVGGRTDDRSLIISCKQM